MLKVKFVMPGQDNLFLYNRIIKNFSHKGNKSSEIGLTGGDDFDYLILCNGPTHNNGIDRNRTIGVIMEPSWSLNWNRNLSDYCSTIITHDNNLFNFSEVEVIEHPSLMFTEFYNSPQTVDYFMKSDFTSKRNKICAIISGIQKSGNTLYSARRELVSAIIKSKLPVDIYGRFWEKDGKNLKGPFEKKMDILLQYDMCITIENSSEKNYVSEKFFDPLLVNTIPVYHGCPNIKKIYNRKSFIPLNMNSINSALNQIEDLLQVNRDDYIESIKKEKEKYFYTYNLYTVITDIIKKKEKI